MTAASFVAMTSTTGGAGSLVLGPVSQAYLAQAAKYTDVWGTSGNAPWVDYSIHQYVDAALTTLAQSEHGTCPLTFSGGIGSLDRAAGQIWSTFVYGIGYLPSANSAAQPTALSFGTDPNLIRISVGRFAGGQYLTPPFENITNSGTIQQADLLGEESFFAESFYSLAFQPYYARYYAPYYIAKSGMYSKATVLVFAGGLGNARWALYDEDGTGWANNLRIDWTAAGGAQWNIASTGLLTSTLSSPVYIPAGWYVAAFASNGNQVMQGRSNVILSPMGTQFGGHCQGASINASYGAFPSTADAASGVTFTSEANGPSPFPTILIQ